MGADLARHAADPPRLSRLIGEGSLASNLDRGLFVADPVATGIDVRELGFYAPFVQDIARWRFVGFRVDVYNPNADFFDSRRRPAAPPTSQAITTLSPLVGVPHRRARAPVLPVRPHPRQARPRRERRPDRLRTI